MDFDKILIKCGDFSRYQFTILALFGFINIITSIHYFSQTVISFVPDHWCYHQKLATYSFADIEKIYANYTHPSCTRLSYNGNNTNNSDANQLYDVGKDSTNWTVSPERCESWIYKYDYGYRSMNTELNWVCDAEYKARIGQAFFFIGSFVGTLLFGWLADKIGRLLTLILANCCASIGDFLTIFAITVPTFSFCRFVSGLAADANYYLMQIIVLEYIQPNKRSICINSITGLFYALGLVSTPWLAVLLGDWQHYLLATSLPAMLVMFFYIPVQESAQWLITRNDIDGAIQRLKNIAKFNDCQVDDSDFLDFRKHCEQKQQEQDDMGKVAPTLFDLFKTPRMRKITLILFFKSIVITLCYEAVARNVEGMGISPVIMLSLNGFTLIPSCVLLALLQDRIGRKAMASGSMLFAGLFTLIYGNIIVYQQQQHQNFLLVALTLATRFGVGIAYISGSLYATELMPTCVRGRGLAAVHVTGFAASALSPFILLLGTIFKPAPAIILSVLFFTGSFVCLQLPETLNKTLPKTIEEGEVFGLGESIFDFPCLRRNEIYNISVKDCKRDVILPEISNNNFKSIKMNGAEEETPLKRKGIA